MCGLVGIAGNLALKDETTMKRLFLLDYFRGPDSTGFAAVRLNGETPIAKVSSHPMDLFDMGRFRSALSASSSSVFLGHNRSATRGAVNHANAHPFQCDHIIGAHNGTLEYSDMKRLEDAVGEKFSVDSQALFTAIAKLGVKEAISLITEGKDCTAGAWALTWYDGVEGTLNFLRNKHRPLWYAYTEDFDKLFWASEWEFIDAAVKMGVGYDLFSKGKENYKYFQFEENVHYSYDVDVLRKGSKSPPKPKAQEIKGKEPKPVVTYTPTGGHDPFMRGTNDGITSSTTRSGTYLNSGSNVSVFNLFGDLHDPLAGFITEEKFKELAKFGCSLCSADVEWGDVGVTIYDRDDILLCPNCSRDNKQNRVYTDNPEPILLP